MTDQLGTPRMVFDQSGSLANVSRHDYLPFGEEVPGGFRSGIPGYATGDNVRQKFTEKERDSETGLDYFGAKYYASTQGRFTSPDEFAGGPDELFEFEESASDNPMFYADIADPQSLNKYSYVYNNPFAFVDPDGHQGKGMCKNLSLPTDGAAKRVLNIVGEARRVTNNILLGPVGSQASDAALDVLNKGAHLFNQAQYGPLGDCANAIQDNPTVQVVTIATAGVSAVADLGSVKSVATAEASAASKPAPSSSAAGMADELSSQIGKNSVGYRTPNTVGHIDLKGKAHFDKASGKPIPTPHVQERTIHRGPNGRTNVGAQTTRPATKQDIRTARKIVERKTK